MRVIIITFYDQSAYGPRYLAAGALRAGHDVLLINFKQFLVKDIRPENIDELERLKREGFLPMYDVNPHYDLACPYPTPVTETDKEVLYARIESFGADVVAMSLTSANLPLVHAVSRDIRSRFPSTPQIWGGIHPTMDPQGCLEFADAVCVGEGDGAFLDYLADPKRTDIANLYFSDGAGGVIANAPRPLVRDLESLPSPIYGEHELLIDDDRELGVTDFGSTPHLVVSSQRGCPFQCSYCLHGQTRRLYPGQAYLRRKSVDFFLDEVAPLVQRFNLPHLFFWDDVFMIGDSWIAEFCEKYPERVGVPFGGYGHPNTTSRAMLERLKAAGCGFVALGVQSGSERITREVYNRKSRNADYIRLGRDLKDLGFEDKLTYDIMTDCPWETEDDCRATVDLLSKMPKAGKVSVKRLAFYPFTPIATRERPDPAVSPDLYRFYDMLYILAGLPGFDPATLAVIADDPHLRDHPKVVEQWAQQLSTLAGQKEALEQRVKELEAEAPWGVKGALRRLVVEIKKRFQK